MGIFSFLNYFFHLGFAKWKVFCAIIKAHDEQAKFLVAIWLFFPEFNCLKFTVHTRFKFPNIVFIFNFFYSIHI